MIPARLEAIVAHHRSRAADDPRLLEELLVAARDSALPRNFAGALAVGAAGPGIALIAEVKRRSPSRGELAPGLVAADLAKAYAAGGAACLSVLTDERFFGGSWEDLGDSREASGLPVLRKDFTVSPLDLCDARINGADAVLLIVAILDDRELSDYLDLAADLELTALVEAHDEAEIDRAVRAGARLVGVNQRDLGDFSVDHSRAERLAGMIPPGVLSVAESGIRSPDDVRRAAAAGYSAVLVGEHLVTSEDPEGEARRLLSLVEG